MKEGFVIKSGKAGEVSPEELGKINRYCRRELTPGEVYTFSVILCDNEIDRDGERFTIGALKRLAALFVGKTGIFDHNPKGENQTARIFDTVVLSDSSRKTAAGEPYTYIKASAYMVRSPKTEELILEIDAGIKKEVSVGCSVAKITCSVCGADLRKEGCEHRKGELVGGKVCHAVLDQPTDAYEWSFVAVPAQRAAGVVKGFAAEKPRSTEVLLKSIQEAGKELLLSAAEQKELAGWMEQSRAEAELGKRYLSELREEIIRLSALTDRSAEHQMIRKITGGLDAESLRELRDAYRKRWNESEAPEPQLAKKRTGEETDNTEFMI
jgi:hypothetical protein